MTCKIDMTGVTLSAYTLLYTAIIKASLNETFHAKYDFHIINSYQCY